MNLRWSGSICIWSRPAFSPFSECIYTYLAFYWLKKIWKKWRRKINLFKDPITDFPTIRKFDFCWCQIIRGGRRRVSKSLQQKSILITFDFLWKVLLRFWLYQMRKKGLFIVKFISFRKDKVKKKHKQNTFFVKFSKPQ